MSFFDFREELNAMRRPAGKKAGDDREERVEPAPAGPGPMTVSELTKQIDRVLRTGLPAVLLVKGEVSNLKLHSSGHAYFTLKDADACINCVMFRSDFARTKFEPKDGMELLVSGRVAVYAQRGSYQFYVTRMEPLGQGALELAFRQLCEKLEKEGLFAPERKKPLPLYPTRIALVTSLQTAALQDMLKVLRRFAQLRLMVYHVPVQGDGAAMQIAGALRELGARQKDLGGIDVIILGRGGGSLEDLWQFNEEVVARAIETSPIPVVSGIGHEIDVSVADLVADYHAHTPTEAAQVVCAQWRTAGDDLEGHALRLRGAVRASLNSARQSLDGVARHEFFRRPADVLSQRRQRVDELSSGIEYGIQQRVGSIRHRIGELALRLAQCSPRELISARLRRLAELELRLQCRHPNQAISLGRQRVNALAQQHATAGRHLLAANRSRVDLLERHLSAIGPQQVLARGYSITTIKKGGAIVRSKAQVKGGQRLITRVADGEIESVAEDPNQPTLFE